VPGLRLAAPNYAVWRRAWGCRISNQAARTCPHMNGPHARRVSAFVLKIAHNPPDGPRHDLYGDRLVPMPNWVI
jgi:hypothetical protein